MKIFEHNLVFYLERLRRGAHFSFPGFSDSEWFSMMGKRLGTTSGLGQLHTKEIGERLIEAAKVSEKDYFRAAPKCLRTVPGISDDIDVFIARQGIPDGFYERDMVLDDLAAEPGGLKPLIAQLRKMPVYYIGNSSHRGLHFLNIQKFFEVTSPNFHLEPGGIDRIVEEVLEWGKPGVYLFSCGMSDAVMIGKLHGKVPGFLIDVGSIFDAFVGAGGQREWRSKLYRDPKAWLNWVNSNL